MHYKEVAEIAAHTTTVLATVAAALWFWRSDSFQRKLQFDVQCATFAGTSLGQQKLVELTFLLENKGQVTNRCYTLAYEIEAVEVGRANRADRVVLHRSGNIVPCKAEYYYVRAGVTQHITARKWVPATVSTVRVRAFILYDKCRQSIDNKRDLFEQMYEHRDWTARDRIFSLAQGEGSDRRIASSNHIPSDQEKPAPSDAPASAPRATDRDSG